MDVAEIARAIPAGAHGPYCDGTEETNSLIQPGGSIRSRRK